MLSAGLETKLYQLDMYIEKPVKSYRTTDMYIEKPIKSYRTTRLIAPRVAPHVACESKSEGSDMYIVYTNRTAVYTGTKYSQKISVQQRLKIIRCERKQIIASQIRHTVFTMPS